MFQDIWLFLLVNTLGSPKIIFYCSQKEYHYSVNFFFAIFIDFKPINEITKKIRVLIRNYNGSAYRIIDGTSKITIVVPIPQKAFTKSMTEKHSLYKPTKEISWFKSDT